MPQYKSVYSSVLEHHVSRISELLTHPYEVSKRSVAILLLQKDEEIIAEVKKLEMKNFEEIMSVISKYESESDIHPIYSVGLEYRKISDELLKEVVTYHKKDSNKVKDTINNIVLNPISGTIILLFVLYFGFYQFVGVFGAGLLVGLIEHDLFDNIINPFVNGLINTYIPWKPVADLIGNDYGIFTLAFKYSIAIVLPVVGCFFLMFSVIEDSGYLPRISFLMDRAFKKIGLNGRAVIPMTLGFGCDTMATMVSRTLETNRERIIATFLLALAIPCSAQLGVILALLSAYPLALLIWIVFMVLIFLFVGFLSSKVLPGNAADFYIELPPLRMPKFINVVKKTYARMYWYFVEVLPLFVLASLLLWLGNLTGGFKLIVDWISPMMHLLGLPNKMGEVFLYGFFRRDFGAAGLLDMQGSGLLNVRQLTVSAVTLTLFVPCIAQFTMMIKERGWKMAVGMAAFIFPFAFGCGIVVNWILSFIGILG